MRRPRRPQVEELETRSVPSATAATAAAPAPTYTIRLHDLGQGQSAQVTDRTTDVLTLQVKTASGVPFLQHQDTTGSNFAYRETVLQKPAGAALPTRLQRQYQTAQETQGRTTTVLPFQGHVVLITRQAGVYHFQVPGGSAAANQAAAQTLASEFNGPAAQADPAKLLLPPRPVAVNQPWHIDPRRLLPVLGGAGIRLGTAGASATGVLTRVYQQGGHRFGTFTFALTLPVLTLPLAPLGNAAAARGSQAVVHVTADGCIDGSVDTGSLRVDVQITAKATVSAPGGQHFLVSVTDHDTEVETQRQLPR